MKNITESLKGIQDITPYLNGERVDEGLKDIFKSLKSKFKGVWQWFKGLVVKVGSYILPVTDEGIVMPAISPFTMGQAMVDGKINKSNTAILMGKEGQRITGCKQSDKDAIALYGPGNSIAYWNRMIKECEELYPDAMLNEAKLHTDDAEAKYNIIVDDTELRDTIKHYIVNKNLPRLLIWGAPGIGKTAVLMAILDEFHEMKGFEDYQLIVKTLSNETPDNFTLPKYAADTTDDDWDELAKELGREPSMIAKLMKRVGLDKAMDIPKTWLPVYKPTKDKELDALLDAKCGKGLLFVDELSRATPQVLNVMLPLINEGMFNGYKLGSGWTIVTASNRMEDEFSGQSEIGTAMSNRFAHVYYEPTVHSWRKWADQQGFISPLLLQWLSMPESEEMSGGKFYYMDPNEELSKTGGYTKLMCTPRSWTNAMRDLACYARTGSLEGFTIFDIPYNIIEKTLNRHVPSSVVDGFVAFLKVIEKVGDFDRCVYDVWQNGGKSFNVDKKDLNRITLPVAQLICNAHSDALPTQKEWENLCDWLVKQNSNQLASYVLDIFKHIYLSELPKSSQDFMFWMRQFQDETYSRLGIAPGTTSAAPEKRGKGRPRKDAGVATDVEVDDEDLRQIKTGETVYAKFCAKWGVDYYDLPDYSAGLEKLGDKFGEAFNTATVGKHTSALG